MILFTTSRKPVQSSRSLARLMAKLIPYSEYITRGKMGIEKLAEVARTKGYETVCIISESHGNPSAFMFLKTFPETRWEQKIEFRVKELKKIKKPSKSILVQGTDSEKFKTLFNIQEEEEGGTVVITDKEKWIFKTDEGEIITIYIGGAKK